VVLRGVNAPSISWNDHLGRYVSVSSRLLSNDVLVRTAPAIEGPWPTMGLVITPSEGGILAAGEGNDYLAMEQAGLGDASGRSIAFE
jgi:hypothetical protein